VDKLLLTVLLVQSAIRAIVLQAVAVKKVAGGVEETTEVTLHGEGHVQPRATVTMTTGDVVQLQTVTLLVAEPDHRAGTVEVKATHGVDQNDLQAVAATRAAGGKEPEEELLRLVMTMAQRGLLRLVMMMAQGGRRLQRKKQLL